MNVFLRIGIVLVLTGCVMDPSKNPEVRRLSAINELRRMQLSKMAVDTSYAIDRNGEEHAKAASIERVKYLLKDPDSAKFRNVQLKSIDDGLVFCGEVNSKNSYGGYAGFTWFVAGVSEAQLFYRDTRRDMASDDAANNIGISIACGKY